MSAALALAQIWLFAGTTEARGLKWLLLGVLIALGMAVYAAAGQAFGAFDLREAARLLTRRRAG